MAARDRRRTSTRRCTSAPTARTGSATTRRSSSRPTASWSRARASCTSRVTAGYHEDRYFRPGPARPEPFPPLALDEARLGLPTCWDQWFPELARAYSLEGADVLVYPTAIGSEPDHPELRHRAAVGAGDHRQRDRQRRLHGRRQPHRRGAAAALLRLVVHLRSLRAQARAGAARRAGRAGRRSRPRPAPRLARAVPVPQRAGPTPTARSSIQPRRASRRRRAAERQQSARASTRPRRGADRPRAHGWNDRRRAARRVAVGGGAHDARGGRSARARAGCVQKLRVWSSPSRCASSRRTSSHAIGFRSPLRSGGSSRRTARLACSCCTAQTRWPTRPAR